MSDMPLSQIICPVDISDFPQYTEFAQYKQIVAIQVPMVYDQCLLKKCLMDVKDPRVVAGTGTPPTPPACPNEDTVSGLEVTITLPTGVTPPPPVNFREFRNFSVDINSINTSTISPTKKLVTITYDISFIVDALVGDDNESSTIKVTGLTETVQLNAPDNPSQISVASSGTVTSEDDVIFKLEFLPDLENSTVYFQKTNPTTVVGYISLCYSLIVKSELHVQMLVPFYGFFNQGRPCAPITEVCPCAKCLQATPGGSLYPTVDFSVFQCNSSTTPSKYSSDGPIGTAIPTV